MLHLRFIALCCKSFAGVASRRHRQFPEAVHSVYGERPLVEHHSHCKQCCSCHIFSLSGDLSATAAPEESIP